MIVRIKLERWVEYRVHVLLSFLEKLLMIFILLPVAKNHMIFDVNY